MTGQPAKAVDKAASLVTGERPDATLTRRLMLCGVVAGPLFVLVALVQMLIRNGFDITRHPISALSLGAGGWIQIANFVLTGLLSVAFAVGVWRALHPGPAGTWGSLLLGVFGIGLVAAGVFVPDGAYGFPAGAPAGMPERLSWHAMVHGASASLAFASLAVACFVFVRRFGRQRRWGWLAASVVTGVAAPVLSVWPDSDGASVRFAVATVLVFTWLTALAVQLRSALARAGAH